MESFFFVPGSRLHKIPEIQKLNVSQIIIDLEDAVKYSERQQILEQLISNSDFKNFYIRIPLYTHSEIIDTAIFDVLYENGFRKFIFPKVQKATDFDLIISEKKDVNLEIILLVETTRFFLEVKEILLKYDKIFTGIGIGSHDFMAEVGGLHTLSNLEYVRLQILYLARMINVKAIDIASMELQSAETLIEEIVDGLNKGYDAKFFIHPWQINVKQNVNLYTENDLIWARKVKEALNLVGNSGEFNPVVIDGQIIERPHLNKAEKIIQYYESK